MNANRRTVIFLERPRRIEAAFQLVRGFCLLVIVGALGLVGCGRLVRGTADGSGGAADLFAGERESTGGCGGGPPGQRGSRSAGSCADVFHEDFTFLDPDERVIRTNISRALYLADGSAKRAWENLKENGYYSGIISGNISSRDHGGLGSAGPFGVILIISGAMMGQSGSRGRRSS